MITVYDAVYQKFIIDEPIIEAIIYTPEFQRLKNINQLGVLPFVRPSTQHTRYSHSVGVYFLLHKLLQRSIFNHLSKREKLEIEIAGLLHDIGHGPFSHSFELIFSKFKHEQMSTKIIRNSQGKILTLLKKHKLNVQRICDLILSQAKNDWAQSLISCQFDFDRLDYLIRDSHFIGWNLNLGDVNFLIDGICLIDNRIVFTNASLLYVENYLIFRFYIYKRLFWDQKSLLVEGIYRNIFQRIVDLYQINPEQFNYHQEFRFLLKNQFPSLSQFLELDDQEMLMWIRKTYVHTKDKILHNLIRVLLYAPAPYNDLFSEDKNTIVQFSPTEKKYFTFRSNQKIIIYSTKEKEIMFLNKDNKIVPMSKISQFINTNKIYKREYLLYLKS